MHLVDVPATSTASQALAFVVAIVVIVSGREVQRFKRELGVENIPVTGSLDEDVGT